jgi:hypothetical protein
MRTLLFILFFLFAGNCKSSSLSIDGTYQGKNLYVRNPTDYGGCGYCVTKVMVNGDIMPGGANEEAFEINFANFNISLGDPLFIIIEHHEGCSPKILNPEVLLPKSTFIITQMSVSKLGKLTWTSSGESGKLPYIIEQFRWNKWVAVGEVEGIGTIGLNKYEFMVIPHSGENTVRVVQVDHSGSKRVSNAVKFKSTVPKVVKNPLKVKESIQFFALGQPVETRYEIFDAYGNILIKGFGSSVDCSKLINGAYYINFDNVNEKFIKN